MTRSLLDNYEDLSLILDKGAELIQIYRNDPILAAYELLNIDLAPVQRIVLRDMWFKNFVITVASRGFGKSQAIDSLVYFKDSGLVYLYEVLPRIPTYLRDGEDDVINFTKEIYTSNGFIKTKYASLEKNITGKKLITRYGFVNKGSNHHRLLSIGKNGQFLFKGLDEFNIGDIVCLQRGTNIFGTSAIPLEDAYLLGKCIANSVDDKFCDVLSKYKLNKYKVIEFVPSVIRRATQDVVAMFLSGFFDAAGVHTKDSVYIIHSYTVLSIIQLMLLNFGIIAKLECIGNKYKLTIKNEEVNIVDGYGINSYFLDEVMYVEDWNGDCYDFELDMPSDIEPNYFANGFINHNTFLLGVNAVLHALLYPGYRIGLISPSFRQCLVLSDEACTFWTNDGLYSSTKELYNNIKKTESIQSLYECNNIRSKWVNIKQPCIKLKCEKGFELSGSENHNILIYRNGNFVYESLKDLSEDDYVVIRLGMNCFGNNNTINYLGGFPKEITKDLAYMLGLLVGNGSLKENNVEFSSDNEELINKFSFIIEELFGISINVIKDNNNFVINISNKKLIEFFKFLGFTNVTDNDKSIPNKLKKCSKDILIEFIKGLYDINGKCYTLNTDKNNLCSIEYISDSLKLCKELQAILLNLGIMSSLYLKGKDGQFNNIYKLSINGTYNSLKFYELIGFTLSCKQSILKNYVYSILSKCNIPTVELDNRIELIKIKNKEYFDAITIDIEVDNESCYWSNGFISHNSKMIFSEVDKIYQRSSIVREACEKKPVRGADICYLRFKGTERSNGSYIEALPLGVDGAKIRGSRFYLIEIDELAQMPADILDLVIRPMGAVSLEPMQRVRELERQRELIEAGLATEEDFIDNMSNKMIMTSSGYFKFNHMWKRMKSYWKAIEEGESDKYAVHQIPYTLLPKGFLDEDNIKEAKRTMSTLEFLMEYEAQMISDSSGFYKASLIEDCSTKTGFTVDSRGKKDREYILGVDPNQAGRAAAGLIVIELGSPNKIIYAMQLHEKTTQGNVKKIQQLSEAFNLIGIYMDSMGGGKAWRDLLQEGYDNNIPILDVDIKDNRHIDGKRILHLINPSPQWISDANFNLLALFENKELVFPELPLSANPELEKIYDEVKVLKSQLVNIVVTQTARGVTHFDTPKRDQNKDLYSALVLAAWGVKMSKHRQEEDVNILHPSGLVRPHTNGAKFNITSKQTSIYKGALLKRN